MLRNQSISLQMKNLWRLCQFINQEDGTDSHVYIKLHNILPITHPLKQSHSREEYLVQLRWFSEMKQGDCNPSCKWNEMNPQTLKKINIYIYKALKKDISVLHYFFLHQWAQCNDLIFVPIVCQISAANIEIKCFTSSTWPGFLSGCT